MRLERRDSRPATLMVVAPILAVLVALALSGVLIALAGSMGLSW